MSSATVIQCIHVQCRYCDVICTIYRVHSTLCVVIIMKLQPYLYCFCVHLPLTIRSLSWWIIYLHACTVFVHRPIIRRTIVDYCSLLRFVPNRWFVSSTGLLIFRAVAEPRISTRSAKSREIHQNTRNPAKFARNLTKYMSAQYIWKLSWLLGRLLAVNVLICLETSSQHPKTTRRSLINVAKNWEAMMWKPRRS